MSAEVVADRDLARHIRHLGGVHRDGGPRRGRTRARLRPRREEPASPCLREAPPGPRSTGIDGDRRGGGGGAQRRRSDPGGRTRLGPNRLVAHLRHRTARGPGGTGQPTWRGKDPLSSRRAREDRPAPRRRRAPRRWGAKVSGSGVGEDRSRGRRPGAGSKGEEGAAELGIETLDERRLARAHREDRLSRGPKPCYNLLFGGHHHTLPGVRARELGKGS